MSLSKGTGDAFRPQGREFDPTASGEWSTGILRANSAKDELKPYEQTREKLALALKLTEESLEKLFAGNGSFLTLANSYIRLQLDVAAIREDRIDWVASSIQPRMLAAKALLVARCESDGSINFDRTWKSMRRGQCDSLQKSACSILDIDIIGLVRPAETHFKEVKKALREVAEVAPAFVRVSNEAVSALAASEQRFVELRKIISDLKIYKPKFEKDGQDILERAERVEREIKQAEVRLQAALRGAKSIRSDLFSRDAEQEFLIRNREERSKQIAPPIPADVAISESPFEDSQPLDPVLEEERVDLATESLAANSSATEMSVKDRGELLVLLGVPANLSEEIASRLSAEEIIEIPKIAETRGVSPEQLKMILLSNPEYLSSISRFTREMNAARELFDRAYRHEIDPANYTRFDELKSAVDLLASDQIEPIDVACSAPDLSPEEKLSSSVLVALKQSASLVRKSDLHADEILAVATQILSFGFAFKGQLHTNIEGISSDSILKNSVKSVSANEEHAVHNRFNEALRRLVREGIVATADNSGYHLVREPVGLADPALRQVHTLILDYYRERNFRIL